MDNLDPNRIVLLGAGGQLASDLEIVIPEENLTPLKETDLDICDFMKTRSILEDLKPDVVINTAAFVRVDDCEDQFEKAFQINAYAVRNIANICEDLNCSLVQISTDYVFGGEKREPYIEDDLPDPINVYGASKLVGEYFALNYCQKSTVVRSSGLYGSAGSLGKGGNFVETMIAMAEAGKPIRVVDDQILTPTYTVDLSKAIYELIGEKVFGTFHLTNQGSCSWYEFAKEIFSRKNMKADLTPIPTSQYPTPARRPLYSVLENKKLVDAGVGLLPTWQDALRRYLIS